jgi:hypothetical protein
MLNKCCGCCKIIENKIHPSEQEEQVQPTQSNVVTQPTIETNPYVTEYTTENPLPDDYFTSDEHPQHIPTAPSTDEW